MILAFKNKRDFDGTRIRGKGAAFEVRPPPPVSGLHRGDQTKSEVGPGVGHGRGGGGQRV